MTIKTRQSASTPVRDRATAAEPTLPLLATSMFCDDVRLEATGKFSMIGCYPGNVILASPEQPVGQLWVFTKLRWHNGFDPAGLRMRIDLPAREPGYMAVQTSPDLEDTLSKGALCIWNLRFHPLRAGDLLRISVEQGAASLACGELLAIAPTQPTRH